MEKRQFGGNRAKGKKMEYQFGQYAWEQFAIGNDAKFNAFLGLALDIVARVQGWNAEAKRESKAEAEAKLSIALTVAKVPETSARRYLATVSGLVTRFGSDHRATLEAIRADMAEAESTTTPADAVAVLRSVLVAEGVESLGFLETYARKGKAGVAGLAAEFAAKAEARAKAEAMTEEEAKEAAKAAEAEAEAAKADQTPRAKAAKQAAAILGSLAKHGDNMTDDELSLILSAISEQVEKRRRLAAEAKVLTDQAEAARIKAEEKREAMAEAKAKAA